ncbi:hypothetical protein GCM10018965_011670 [Nonomuraea roseola]
MRVDLAARLIALEQKTSPFVGPIPAEHAQAARRVRPVLVGEVRCVERPLDGRLRHPSWRGLRTDWSTAKVAPIGRRHAG